MFKNQSYKSFKENLDFVRSCSNWGELDKLSKTIWQTDSVHPNETAVFEPDHWKTLWKHMMSVKNIKNIRKTCVFEPDH